MVIGMQAIERHARCCTSEGTSLSDEPLKTKRSSAVHVVMLAAGGGACGGTRSHSGRVCCCIALYQTPPTYGNKIATVIRDKGVRE